MKKYLPIWILFLFFSGKTFGQPIPNESFNRAFLHIYMHTASENIDNALKAADSLYLTAENDTQQIRALMLIADMHHRMASRDSAIYYARLAEQIAERTDNYLWQARIYGVLSTQHRETGLLTAGRQYVEKGLAIVGKIDNPEAANQFKGQCFQELGFYDVEEKHYNDALANFRRAEPFFVALTDSMVRSFVLAQNDERIGLCYLELGAVDSAAFFYHRAMAHIQNASGTGTPVEGFIYNGLGQVHLANKQFGQADSCFQQALAVAEATDFPNLKISVYHSLATYYEVIGNNNTHRQYIAKYLAAIKENEARHKRYADHLFARVQDQLLTMTASTKALTITVIGILAVAGLGFLIYVRKQRANHKRYQAIIKGLKDADRPALTGEQMTAASTGREKELMPENTKQELLKKLELFETSQQFTDRNISVAVLAGKMKTNTKYLSYIINNYRHKDFNSYINELRINYIIAKMDEDSHYLNYKISYLAEECGFATHSQFTTVFKNITGLSPSVFMLYRRKDDHPKDIVMLD